MNLYVYTWEVAASHDWSAELNFCCWFVRMVFDKGSDLFQTLTTKQQGWNGKWQMLCVSLLNNKDVPYYNCVLLKEDFHWGLPVNPKYLFLFFVLVLTYTWWHKQLVVVIIKTTLLSRSDTR